MQRKFAFKLSYSTTTTKNNETLHFFDINAHVNVIINLVVKTLINPILPKIIIFDVKSSLIHTPVKRD